MSSDNVPRKYGLQLPTAKKKAIVFKDNDEDEVDIESGPTNHIAELLKQKQNTKLEKTYNDALKDDPTAFEYDSVYDSMKEQDGGNSRKALQHRAGLSTRPKEEPKQSKYIASLVESAQKKKRELDRLKEKQMQKERDIDADKYKDKESYITDSYREKLERDKKEREEQDRLDQLEEKQQLNSKTFQSFQKNLYNDVYNKDEPSSQSRTNQQNITTTKFQSTKESTNIIKKDVYRGNYDNINRPGFSNRKEQPQQQRDNKEEKESNNKNIFMARRNDDKSIQAARERYLERKHKREKDI
ncbi:hypothetical protein DLAC_00665 [Tieghemostelium lacteum]|uniref:Nuclear speckle splicing regulatory protein 1 N-terminal domain-containing protein n=1 Tax=Tieghemostelium lacteum TaxID=361077 RepID=A0A152AAD8_TIELA|nr:hypothetical protein DLAC_00665 [Tieghemostelium lacteum]|eukprot:KYR03164.1 hypothetical protein DLAC_00665 [Tieghemostelium lacteum]